MATSSSNTHAITVCTDCRITGKPCRPGLELLARLNESLAQVSQPLERDFSVSGTVCMAGCTRPCTIAFQASGKATYLFGDILPDQSIEDLMAFADLYAGRSDGLTREVERPRSLSGKTIARIPAAVMASESLGERLQ